MKLKAILLIGIVSIFSFTSCDKDEKDNAPDSLFVTYNPRPDDVLLANSSFEPFEPFEVTGGILLYKNSFHHVLRFNDFSIDNGPELKVYLATDSVDVSNSIFVGDLLAVSGSFNYTFSVNTDISLYNHVIVRSEGQEKNYCFALF